MIVLPPINPEALRIGPLAVRWYGLMYLVGFCVALVLGSRRASKNRLFPTPDDFNELLLFAMIGVLVGGRLGYVVFYTNMSFLQNPQEILEVWKGGMSFHGGIIGVLIAVLIFCRYQGLSFWSVTDFLAPLAPPGLFAGRIGNFINGELWGRPSDLPWAMVFSSPASCGVSRHPSQLYEALLEGIVLFVVLWVYSNRSRPNGAVSGLFLLLYGAIRFLVEFSRQPDSQMGFIALNWLTMGQTLSLPMVAAGTGLLIWSHRYREMGGY